MKDETKDGIKHFILCVLAVAIFILCGIVSNLSALFAIIGTSIFAYVIASIEFREKKNEIIKAKDEEYRHYMDFYHNFMVSHPDSPEAKADEGKIFFKPDFYL